MRHRGPDDEGYLFGDMLTGDWVACGGEDTIRALGLPALTKYERESYNLAFGHRRLSVLDLSAAGHGPMSYLDGQLWTTYNGEVYNYVELREELKGKGYSFRSGTDTEVILAAYAEWGLACLHHFNGMWAFAIWDQRQHRLFCARDRFGIKPFHFYWDGQLFVFASEIKALLAHPAILNRPNDAIIYDYLALGSLGHTDETFFEGIKCLQPSHYLLIDLEQCRLEIGCWWDVHVDTSLNRNESENDRDLAVQFRELLIDAVRLRLRSDVPIGTCLSGGLDSSSIVSAANYLLLEERAVPQKLVGNKQKTFSACFDDPAIDERPYIDQVIQFTGAESNQVFPQGAGGLWDDLEQLVWFQEEPFGSTSIYSQWNVMRLARQRDVTVLLDGQGGDELLAGYHLYIGPYLTQTMRTRGLWATLKTVRELWIRTDNSMAFLLALGLYNSLPGSIQRLTIGIGNTRFRTNPTISLSMLNSSFERRFHERRLGQGKHRGYDNLAERLHQDLFLYSLPALLRYEDRNSMAFSLEARVPFLDYRLVEFCFSLPVSQLIRHGWTKWLLRQAMEGFLPEQVTWRRDKLGFATPEQQWLREGVRWITQLFGHDEIQTLPYLHTRVIQQLRSLSANDLINIPGLWRIVNLEMWHRVFFGEDTVKSQ
jgi:asparagine synthase (glutamine-hydrolysing)